MPMQSDLDRLERIADYAQYGHISVEDFQYLRNISNETLGVTTTEAYLGRSESTESLLSKFVKGGIIVVILAIIAKILGGGSSGGGGGGGGGGGTMQAVQKVTEAQQKNLSNQMKAVQERAEFLESQANVRLEQTMKRMIEDVKIERELAKQDEELEKLAKKNADIKAEAKLYEEQFKFIDRVFKYDFNGGDGLVRKIALAKALQKYGKSIKDLAAMMKENSGIVEGETNEDLVLRIIYKGREEDQMVFYQRQRTRNISQTPIANDAAISKEYTDVVKQLNELIADMYGMAERMLKIPENAHNGLTDIISRASNYDEAIEKLSKYHESEHHTNFVASLDGNSDTLTNYLALHCETKETFDSRTAVVREKLISRRKGDSVVHKAFREFANSKERWFDEKVVLNPSLAVKLLDTRHGDLARRIDMHSEIAINLERLERALSEIVGHRTTEERMSEIWLEIMTSIKDELESKFPDAEKSEANSRKMVKMTEDIVASSATVELVMREVILGYGKLNFAETVIFTGYKNALGYLVDNLEKAEKSLLNLTSVFQKVGSVESYPRIQHKGVKWLEW